jgi:hypothetical protein
MSALQFQAQLGITYKTAWRHRQLGIRRLTESAMD